MIKDFTKLFKKGNIAVTTDVTFKPGGEAMIKKCGNGGHDVVRQRTTDSVFTGVTATMNANSIKSKKPERAIDGLVGLEER